MSAHTGISATVFAAIVVVVLLCNLSPTAAASTRITKNAQQPHKSHTTFARDHQAVPLGTNCKAPLTPGNPSSFWVGSIVHNGTAAYHPNPSSYTVYRNVRDFGAKGDGVTDDTNAINAAIASGNRCGEGCDSSTIVPALVYFPSGTYLISRPIVQYYYTQLVGDAVILPTLLAAPSFSGMAVIDSDPYGNGGNNWYTNQNNFYRQIRNFVIDLRRTNPLSSATGVHWQVAQATSLTNLVFEMSTETNTNHQGVWMENGSGGFISDLVFRGGKFGLWVGNQQFTSRNITITNARTAIYMNWNWEWTFKTLIIESCRVGVDISSSSGNGGGQLVGSVVLLDVIMNNTPIGILTRTSSTSQPTTSGSLVLDNVHISNVSQIVANPDGSTILPGTSGALTVASWGQGRIYTDNSGKGKFNQGPLPVTPMKSPVLLANNNNNSNSDNNSDSNSDSNSNSNSDNSNYSKYGFFFERPRPQYQQYNISDIINVKSAGAVGDGVSDDTHSINTILANYAGCKIIFFPAGVYLVTNTVFVPAGSRIVGETWSVIAATGATFSDPLNPAPMLQVGNSGDSGVAEISDILFSTRGAVPGAILVQWNIRDPYGAQGVSGMWDCHFRVGGALGTNLDANAGCVAGGSATPKCQGAFAMMHITTQASVYMENVWAWTADHDLDNAQHPQVSVYNARGILCEAAKGPVWMYGTAAEHNVMFQYSFVNAQNALMAMIQTETPYYQSSPPAPLPFATNDNYHDPDFSKCPSGSVTCPMAWGLRVVDSSSVFVYGAGLYNFFQNYNQACLQTESCQDTMVDIEVTGTGDVDGAQGIYVYNLNTKAAVNMIAVNGVSGAKQADNRNTFCSTINAWLAQSN